MIVITLEHEADGSPAQGEASVHDHHGEEGKVVGVGGHLQAEVGVGEVEVRQEEVS